MNEEFQRYLNDDFTLAANEHYQLGFRIGKKSGLEKLDCYDTMSVPWLAGELFDYMAQHDADAERKFEAAIEQVTQEAAANHQSMSFQELMLLHNDPEQDRRNQALYLMTNDVGAGDKYVGADAAASWWHRNFRMYANIQKLATPDTRVIVVAGQGHTAILRDLMRIDSDRDLVDVVPFLAE